jgi:hypothetical protein
MGRKFDKIALATFLSCFSLKKGTGYLRHANYRFIQFSRKRVLKSLINEAYSSQEKFSESVVGQLPKSAFYSDQSDEDLLMQLISGFLSNSGWIESIRSRRPLKNASPIPWFVYPAIDFLNSIELEGKTVLEVGGGFSTLYWAARGCRGVSLELDIGWSNSITRSLSEIDGKSDMKILNISQSENIPTKKLKDVLNQIQIEQLRTISSIEFPEESLDFIESETLLIDQLFENLPYCDIFIVDGVARNLSLMMAENFCKSSALVILDNSDRSDYSMGKRSLELSGWDPTEFSGLGPINPYQWSTTVFRKR